MDEVFGLHSVHSIMVATADDSMQQVAIFVDVNFQPQKSAPMKNNPPATIIRYTYICR